MMPLKFFKKTMAQITGIELSSKMGVVFMTKIIGLLIGYINLVLIAKNYGATELGVYVICFTILSIMQVISKFGMETSLIKLINQTFEDKKTAVMDLFTKAVGVSVLIGLLASILLYFFSSDIAVFFFQKENIHSEIESISFAIIPSSLLFLIASTFQGMDYAGHSMLLKHALVQLLFAILLIFNMWFGKAFSVTEVYLGATCMSFLISVFLIIIKMKELGYNDFNYLMEKSNTDRVQISSLLSVSVPMLLSSSVFFLMNWTDSLMLGRYVSEEQVGFFNACFKLSSIIGVSLVVINSMTAQKFASLFAQNRISKLKEIVQNSTKYIFYLSLPPFLILLFFPKLILEVFGTEYMESYSTLTVLVFGQFFNAICGSVGFLMQMCGLHRQHQNIVIITALLNAGLNYLLIPKYGILGAAIANTFSTFLWNALMVMSVKKHLGFSTIYLPLIKIRTR